MKQSRVERLSPALEPAALQMLAREPYHNVFLMHLIRDGATFARDGLYVARDGARLTGVAYFGRQVVVAAEDDVTIARLAEQARAFRGERMIVGERSVVERYWAAVASWHVPPRAIRARQLLMMVDSSTLHRGGPDAIARPARPTEWRIVVENSAKMIEHELGYDPRQAPGDFEAGIRSMIAGGLVWIGEHGGRLCFFCNVGPSSDATLQLQGIWSPPELRGRGLATAALGAIAAALLERVPTLSLYVNDFNAEAIALYERVGFTIVGELRTMLF